MSQVFQGRTEDAESPFLGAEFWEQGKTVRGVVSKVYTLKNNPGTCYQLDLEDSVVINGEETDKASIGNLSGWTMALQQAGGITLRLKDIVEIECTGFKVAKKEGFSPRINFSVKITRP